MHMYKEQEAKNIVVIEKNLYSLSQVVSLSLPINNGL